MFEQYMEQLYRNIIPKRDPDFDPKTVDEGGYTIAMFMAVFNKQIPAEWEYEHFQQPGQMTVALVHAQYGRIPPKGISSPDIWYHDPTYRDRPNGMTVAMLLAAQNKGEEIPKQWRHDPLLRDNSGRTVAMCCGACHSIPPKEWEHSPTVQDHYGRTVAHHLSHDKLQLYNYPPVIIPPKQWEHDPTHKDESGFTVAMNLVCNRIIPPKQWEHDPAYKNHCDMTVGMILTIQNIEVPRFWQMSHERYINYITRRVPQNNQINKLYNELKTLKQLNKKINYTPIIGEPW